ncbi:MAG: LON peptidase substrate-binding domain-containing protein [Luteimonas sp.]
MDADDLPLFPLNTVLFPGGQLALRIFEARYLDLIRECSHKGVGFGVNLILSGQEVAAPALPAAVGCEARIVDFSSTAEGLLLLSVQGGRRFHVERSRVRDNGLIIAKVSWFDTEPSSAVRPEHQLLTVLLRRIVECAGPPHDQVDEGKFDDAQWLGWRLAEWLPLTAGQRQGLLQESDAHQRLQRLVELIPDIQES